MLFEVSEDLVGQYSTYISLSPSPLFDMQEGPIFELEIPASLCLAEILKLIVHVRRSGKYT